MPTPTYIRAAVEERISHIFNRLEQGLNPDTQAEQTNCLKIMYDDSVEIQYPFAPHRLQSGIQLDMDKTWSNTQIVDIINSGEPRALKNLFESVWAANKKDTIILTFSKALIEHIPSPDIMQDFMSVINEHVQSRYANIKCILNGSYKYLSKTIDLETIERELGKEDIILKDRNELRSRISSYNTVLEMYRVDRVNTTRVYEHIYGQLCDTILLIALPVNTIL